jgi:hypothetical protein
MCLNKTYMPMKKISLLAGIVLLSFTACNVESTDSDSLKSVPFSADYPSDAIVIDFEGFTAGDIVSSVTPDNGCSGSISVFADNPELDPGNDAINDAMVFDSSNPTGGDVDLGTPNDQDNGPGISTDGPQPSNDIAIGNVLIITEDGDATDPDDSYVSGSYYAFDFTGYGTGYVTLYGFDMLDLDGKGPSGESTTVILYDPDGNELFSATIPPGEDNNKQWVDLGATTGVGKMVINLNNSGAIDNITLKCRDKMEFDGCETAFGFGGDAARCFARDGFSRWGWTNGPLADGERISLDLYAGAGQCDLEKGTLVGTVTIVYEGGTATASYKVFDGISLEETHFYAGENMYPQKKRGKNGYVNTVAPGQYPASGGPELSVDGLEGPIWVIAHAVVCGEDD